MNYMLRNLRKSEQEYKKFKEGIQERKRKNTENNVKIIMGSLFLLLYLSTVISFIILMFKDTTMSLNIHKNISPLMFFLRMFIAWILVAAVFYFPLHCVNKHKKMRLYKKVNIFIMIANIYMYSAWFTLIFYSPIAYMLHRLAVATFVLIIMFLISRYIVHRIWRCPACHTPLPISRSGYHVLMGAPVACTVCPKCGKEIE